MGGAFGAFLVIAGVAWFARLDLARLVAIRLLDGSGAGPTTLVVASLDLTGIHARDVSLFAGAVQVEALTISYDPRQLLRGVIRQALIVRPRVVLGLAPGGVRVGVTILGVTGSAGGSGFMDRIRIDGVRIVDARITLDDPSGSAQLEATVSTDLVIAGPEVTGSNFVARIERPIPDAAAQSVRVSVPTMTLSLADAGIRLRFAEASAQQRGLAWIIEGLDGEVAWREGRLEAAITSGQMVDSQTPAVLRPVALTAKASMVESRIAFSVDGAVRSSSGRDVIQVDASGQHDLATGRGKTAITAGPVNFRATGPRPQDFFPGLAGALPAFSGSAGLSGSIGWSADTLAPALVLRLSDGHIEQKGVRLSAIRSEIAISGLQPVVTRPRQVVAATLEAGGLAPMQVEMRFQLLPRPALQIDAITTAFLGGVVSTSPFTVDPAQSTVDTRIGLRAVDIGEAFKLIGVDGISGSGRMDGVIPLRVRPGSVDIRDGHLAASGPGVIRLDSDALPKQITDAGESMALVLQALADFHYDVLMIDVAGAAAGDGTVAIRLEGRNPSLLDGRPFHLNIRFASNFGRLVAIALASMEAAQDLLRHTTGSARR